MNLPPKLKDFEPPEGYFDRLPDQILAKTSARNSYSWIKYAAAAVLIIGLGFAWQSAQFTTVDQVLSTEEEAYLYIESQLWTSEDILNLSDDPNGLLDQIIEEELTASGELWAEDELNWF